MTTSIELPPDRVPLAPKSKADGYRIRRCIGYGGFSLVYSATHADSDEKVVLKEYYPSKFVSRQSSGRVEPIDDHEAYFLSGLRRFFEEAHALSSLKHPNIIHVSGIFRDNNTAYMVMKYQHGKDLLWFIKNSRKSITEAFLLSVFPFIADGLDELHQKGFVHLDVKPGNLMILEDGTPILLDFGAVQRPQSGMPFTDTQTTVSRGFAPPEQYTRENVGPWTDIYGLGATMYGCIVGKPPPAAPDRQKYDNKLSLQKNHGYQYSRRLLESVEWAMRLDPAERPQTIMDFLSYMLGANKVNHRTKLTMLRTG